MNNKLYLAMGTSALLLSGCASNNIAENQQFTSSALVYTEQVELKLIEARTLIINNTTDQLIQSRPNGNTKQMLKVAKDETLKEVREIDTIIAVNQALEDYIRAIEALINNPDNQAAERAVSEASTLIVREHYRQRKGHAYYSTSFDSVGSINKLASLGMSAYNAKRVQNILKRDAPKISAVLASQKERMKAVLSGYKGNLKTSELMFYGKDVKAPYTGSGRLPPLWKSNFHTWVNMNSERHKTKALMKAQDNIEKAWHDILQGNLTITSVSHAVADMSVTTQAARQFQDAH
ncbi:hypothetical protein EOL70_05235 [Leucothrix sargassi]|nr:hypothetical protein EOL70_05235 [Leucothrix sargassi]